MPGKQIQFDEDTAWMPRRQAGTDEEILTRDAPNRRYGIGVLYSNGGRTASAEVTTGEGPLEEDSSAAGGPTTIATAAFTNAVIKAQDDLGDETTSQDLDLSGANEYRPTTMAVTFLADLPPGSQVELALSAGRYRERDIAVGAKTRSWWFRSSCSMNATWDGSALISASGSHSPAVDLVGLEGIEIEAFAVSRPQGSSASLLTVGIINRTAGTTPNHFLFQVNLVVTVNGGGGWILAYPETPRAARDEEEELIDLLYRDVRPSRSAMDAPPDGTPRVRQVDA